MAAAILVIGILKITLSKIFQHFVVSVVDFYCSLGLCVGFILMTVVLSSQDTGTSYWGHEIKQMIGIGPYLLIFCSLTYFVAALGHLCSFYNGTRCKLFVGGCIRYLIFLSLRFCRLSLPSLFLILPVIRC